MTYQNKKSTFANRGMGLEDDLEQSNCHYRLHDIALIYKKPTPITIKKVTYPNQKYTKITDGYFKKSSTTDYNGIYKGFYIDFEAKETTSKTSFPLSAIHKHQFDHLEGVSKHGGIAFIIVRFSSNKETFLIGIDFIIDFLKKSDRKSIPYNIIKETAILIKEGYSPRLDYLSAVDKYINQGGYYEKIKCNKI